MSDCIHIFRNRTKTIYVQLPYDVSEDTFISEIREGKASTSPIIATWVVSFDTDGEDGLLKLVLDDSLLNDISQTKGYMDLKRIHDGEPTNAFAEPVRVRFKDTVTL